MKNQKINLLLLFSIILFSLEIKSLLAQGEINWANHTPPPCTNVFGSERDLISWVGPKSLRVCPNGPNGCCFTIVYHDKMYKVNGLDIDPICDRKYDYDVSITGVFFEDVNCANFDKDILFNAFLDQLYRLNSTRKGFRDSLTKCCDLTLPHSYGYLQTKYKCTDGNNIICTPLREGCCNTYKRALFRRVGNDCELVGIDASFPTEFNGPNCLAGCTQNCNILEMKNITDVYGCNNLPCNWDLWGDILTINVPTQCPGCVLQVGYRTRVTIGCIPSYTDYKIEFIIYDWNSCKFPTL